ncbi:MAG TPA: SDR family oxidoreductase, partial [bacterium]|nr:SDR family oxidoreductase [bacterium]
MKKKAIVAGATGLIGGFCLQGLLKNSQYSQVLVLVRKSLEMKHSKLKQLVVDFDHLEKFSKQLKTNDVYCCLGTSRKKSPTP